MVAGMPQLSRNRSSVIKYGSGKLKQRESSATLVLLPTVELEYLEVEYVTAPFWTVTVEIVLDSLWTHTGTQTWH
jgi:hypothetical protein